MTVARYRWWRLGNAGLLAAAIACGERKLPFDPNPNPAPNPEDPAPGPEDPPGPGDPAPGPEEPPPEPAGGVPAIYLADPDGRNISLFVMGERPAWSPDGQRVAFQREGRIHVTDGATDEDLGPGTEPTWAPDGHQLAFRSAEGIAVMADDGGGAATILRNDFRDDTWADSDMGVGRPAWSPDGEWIAFEHLGDGEITPATVFVMHSDGTGVRRLSTAPGVQYAESDPSWSSDSKAILLWSFGSGITRVGWADGTPQWGYQNFPAVAYGAKPVEAPLGSPAAGTVLFTANRYSNAPAIWAIGESSRSSPVLVTGGKDAVWSPDGRKILFVRLVLPAP